MVLTELSQSDAVIFLNLFELHVVSICGKMIQVFYFASLAMSDLEHGQRSVLQSYLRPSLNPGT